jgi:hypothetical protein
MAGKRTLLVAFKHRRRLLMLSAVGEPRLSVPRHAAGGKTVPQMTLVEAGERKEKEKRKKGAEGEEVGERGEGKRKRSKGRERRRKGEEEG